jgi:DNA-binding transcriptional regulator YdaS (Cro superfamily)
MDGATLLRRYLKRNQLSPRAFALREGVNPSSISRALQGKRGLTVESAAKVERGTRGEVPAASWAMIEKPPRGKRAA